MSGGGSKGAFEAGAVYHLVVERHCDFSEFSGVSVGALNSTFLAQAGQSEDSKRSLENLARQAEALVEFWQSIRTSDIRRARRLATLRWGLFGLESMNDMEPLHKLLQRSISTEKLAAGRPARVSVLSFSTGQYREVLAQDLLKQDGPNVFFDYLFASSVVPVYGKLPRIPDPFRNDGSRSWLQFSDASLRHITPVASYFVICNPRGIAAAPGGCTPQWPFTAPPHIEHIEQLFVIVTSPYSSESDQLAISGPNCCRTGVPQIRDGRKILARTLAVMGDTAYRSDLDYMLFANEVLRWQWRSYSDPTNKLSPAPSAGDFVIGSFNHDPDQPNGLSRPYDLGFVMPEKELADAAHLLVLSPQIVEEQLYCGCMAADDTMQKSFGLPSLADQCAQRFPRLLSRKRIDKPSGEVNLGGWAASECARTYGSSEVAQTQPQ